MRRLMALVEHRRVDLRLLVSHHFKLDDILAAYELFSHQSDGVLKVALHPAGMVSQMDLHREEQAVRVT